jgi:hypothetical protein
VPDFVGVTDTTAFTSVLVTTADGSLSLNNVSFSPPLVTVLEPASLSLISIGIAGIGGYRSLRKKRTV